MILDNTIIQVIYRQKSFFNFPLKHLHFDFSTTVFCGLKLLTFVSLSHLEIRYKTRMTLFDEKPSEFAKTIYKRWTTEFLNKFLPVWYIREKIYLKSARNCQFEFQIRLK